MKKTAISGLLLFGAALGTVFVLSSSADQAVREDTRFIDEFLQTGLRTGMTRQEVDRFFATHGREVALWECQQEVDESGKCQSDKALVATVPLPRDHLWLGGRGDAQIYLYFTAADTLAGFEYELYYPRFH